MRPELAGPGNAQVRRPFPQFSGVSVINPPIGNSTYHAFTIKAERRYSAGLTFLGHYTFSKFIDDVTSFSEYGNVGSYMDAYNRRLDKAISGNDMRHRAVISGVYAFPGISASRVLNFIAGGWRTGVIASFQVFTQAFVMTKGGPNYATLFYVLYLYQQAFQWFNMGYAAALAWVLFLVILVFTFVILRTSSKWVYYEGG